MTPTFVTISPIAAAVMLESNTANRPITEASVSAIIKEIKGGRWKVNGDMIRITKSGRILDGQHRLTAVVRAGIAIDTWIMYDVPPDVFDTIDVGKRRSAGDTLGCKGQKNSYRLAAALIMIDKYMTGRMEKSVQYSNTEIEELLLKYPDAPNYLVTSSAKRGLLLPSLMDSLYYLFSQRDNALADLFLERILKGAGLQEGEPWYVLREKLLADSLSKARLSKAYIFALCVHAWNHTRSGNKIKILRLHEKETGKLIEFPLIK
jgi:hypothetical protein